MKSDAKPEISVQNLQRTLAKLEPFRVLPNTFECGKKALAFLLSKIPPSADVENTVSILALSGMAIVPNPALPKNEIHAVSYRKEGGHTVRTLHKIFQLEVTRPANDLLSRREDQLEDREILADLRRELDSPHKTSP